MKSNSIEITIKVPSSHFRVTSQMVLPIQSSKAGSAGTVLLLTLKGLDGNLIFLQILNLLTTVKPRNSGH